MAVRRTATKIIEAFSNASGTVLREEELLQSVDSATEGEIKMALNRLGQGDILARRELINDTYYHCHDPGSSDEVLAEMNNS